MFNCYRVYRVTRSPVRSASASNFLFALDKIHFIDKLQTMLSIENANISIMAMTYLGPSVSGKKYGLQILPNWAKRLMMAAVHARFSGVWFRTEAPQEYTMAFAAKAPEA